MLPNRPQIQEFPKLKSIEVGVVFNTRSSHAQPGSARTDHGFGSTLSPSGFGGSDGVEAGEPFEPMAGQEEPEQGGFMSIIADWDMRAKVAGSTFFYFVSSVT